MVKRKWFRRRTQALSFGSYLWQHLFISIYLFHLPGNHNKKYSSVDLNCATQTSVQFKVNLEVNSKCTTLHKGSIACNPAVLHLSSLKPVSRLDKLLTLLRLPYLLSIQAPVEEADGDHPAANLHHTPKHYAPSSLFFHYFFNMANMYK